MAAALRPALLLRQAGSPASASASDLGFRRAAPWRPCRPSSCPETRGCRASGPAPRPRPHPRPQASGEGGPTRAPLGAEASGGAGPRADLAGTSWGRPWGGHGPWLRRKGGGEGSCGPCAGAVGLRAMCQEFWAPSKQALEEVLVLGVAGRSAGRLGAFGIHTLHSRFPSLEFFLFLMVIFLSCLFQSAVEKG